MFKVKYLFGSEIVTVYDIKEIDENIWFLIYQYGNWKWVESNLYKPIEEELK